MSHADPVQHLLDDCAAFEGKLTVADFADALARCRQPPEKLPASWSARLNDWQATLEHAQFTLCESGQVEIALQIIREIRGLAHHSTGR